MRSFEKRKLTRRDLLKLGAATGLATAAFIALPRRSIDAASFVARARAPFKILGSKDRAISDPIDAVFRWREEVLRKLCPQYGGSTITDVQYRELSGILSSIHLYFLTKADPTMDAFFDWSETKGVVRPKTAQLTGAQALAARQRQIRYVRTLYLAKHGPIPATVLNIFDRGITAYQMDWTIRNLVMNSVGPNLAAKDPKITTFDVLDGDYTYQEIF